MTHPTIQLNREQLLDALCQYSPKEAKDLFLDLFRKKNPPLPSYEKLQKEISAHVKKNKIPHSVVGEAIRWARSQK